MTVLLGSAFLLTTAKEWHHRIYQVGLTIKTNLFGATYFSLVGLHATHVIVGLQAVIDEATRVRRAGHTRRAFLFKLSLLANGIVGAVMAVPIVGYLLGPGLTKASAEESWINLGTIENFPEGETRLATFRDPVTTAWDGQTGDVPCWVRRVSGTTFQVFGNQLRAPWMPGALVF